LKLDLAGPRKRPRLGFLGARAQPSITHRDRRAANVAPRAMSGPKSAVAGFLRKFCPENPVIHGICVPVHRRSVCGPGRVRIGLRASKHSSKPWSGFKQTNLNTTMHSLRKLGAVLSAFGGLCAALSLQAQTDSGAQAAADANPEVLQQFIVTGSNIPTAADALAVPVVSLDVAEMQNSGVETSTLDVLRKMIPSITGIGSENATISTATNYGGAQMFIHGLPVLVLVNGQRVATSSAEAVGASAFVDLNLIPPAAIQSIDVLQDGASAIYGSDALGGVINIILKKDYNGWDAHTHWGQSQNPGHYNERTFSLVGGVSDGKNSITVSAEYSQNPYILFSQRPDTATYGASVNIPGIVDIFNTVPGGVGGNPVPAGGGGGDEFYILAPGVNAPPGGGSYTIQQLVAMGIYVDLGNAQGPNGPAVIQSVYSHLNLASHQTLQESLKRESGSIQMDHKFNANLSASGTLLYSRTITESTLNAQPLGPQIDSPTDPWLDENLDFGMSPPAPGSQYFYYTAPTNPFSLGFLEQGETYSNDVNGVGPYPSGNDVTAHNRFINFPRIFQNTTTQVNAVGQLDGKVGSDYSWTASVDYSRAELHYENYNLLSAVQFQSELNDGTLNPFAINQAPGVLPGTLLGTGYVNGLNDLTTAQFVFRGSPLDLPAGKLSLALGASYSREVIAALADQNSENSGWIDSPSIEPIDQQRKWVSYFGEVELPVFGGRFTFPGLYSMNMDIAYRDDDYYGVGNSKTPKVSIKYEPLGDDFAFRATAGKSFLAPPLYDLYGPTNSGASQAISYTPYGQSTVFQNVQFESQGGSNPKLQPATGTDWTAGFILDPKLVKGLSVAFDYFNSDTHNFFGILAEQTIVQSVEELGPASPYNDLIHFGSINGPVPTAPGQISAHPQHSVWILDNEINVGATAIKGWDATVEYNLPTNSFGKFDAISQITFYNSYLFQSVPSENYYQYAGTATANEATIPRYRTYTSLTWKYRGWELVTNNTFVPAVVDLGTGGSTGSGEPGNATPPAHVGSYVQEDFSASYAFGKDTWLKGLTVTAGVDNAFNRNIPPAYNAFVNTYGDVGEYNGAIGRMYYIDCDYKF
jgi:iron complex outermembrane receptor protein